VCARVRVRVCVCVRACVCEQKIDRIAEAFSQHYFSQRPVDGEGPSRGGFHSWDTVHILTFSIIMLNTDLHNPQVRPRRPVGSG
jgi:Sec7-like guanine-nucleotide exchange factor